MATKSNENEKELLAAAKAGDGNAFGKLLGQYEYRLKRQIGRWLRRPEDVEDVLQQTLLKAWQGLKGFEERSLLSTWLYRIAENASNSYLKTHTTRTRIEASLSDLFPEGCVDSESLPQAGHLDTPEGRLEEKQRLDSLIKVNASLPLEMAETYRLRYWEQMSYQEIAEMLGVPIGTVRSRINRMRIALGQLHGRKK